jgi:hypothetical protein
MRMPEVIGGPPELQRCIDFIDKEIQALDPEPTYRTLGILIYLYVLIENRLLNLGLDSKRIEIGSVLVRSGVTDDQIEEITRRLGVPSNQIIDVLAKMMTKSDAEDLLNKLSEDQL